MLDYFRQQVPGIRLHRRVREKELEQERRRPGASPGDADGAYAEGRRIAMRKIGGSSPGLSYILPDHLGGTYAVVNPDGSNPRYSYYYSFGASRLPPSSPATDKLFTGQQFDASEGLYELGSRHYDPVIGRYLQPDSMGQSQLNDSAPFLPLTVSYSGPGLAESLGQWNRGDNKALAPLDPQLLNRYSYSRNNPETYYDPSGHFVWIIAGAIAGGVVGFGGYYLTHRDNFNWGEAAAWTGGGALAGSGVGLAYELVAGGAVAAGGTVLATEATAEAPLAQEAAESPEAQSLLQRFGVGLPSRGFRSFDALKGAIGRAGDGEAWHHIVEQMPGNIARFGAERIQNTANVLRLPTGAGTVHARISGFYSSIQPYWTGSDALTVRQWLSTKSFEFQYQFGIETTQGF